MTRFAGGEVAGVYLVGHCVKHLETGAGAVTWLMPAPEAGSRGEEEGPERP